MMLPLFDFDKKGGYQDYGPLWGPRNTRCRIRLKTQKWTIILTTTHIVLETSLSLALHPELETQRLSV